MHDIFVLEINIVIVTTLEVFMKNKMMFFALLATFGSMQADSIQTEEMSSVAIQQAGTNSKDINVQDEQGKTALHRAVDALDLEKVKELLVNGANPNIQDSYSKNTPLIYVCNNYHYTDPITRNVLLDEVFESKRLAIVKELLAHGANTNLQGSYGSTALHQAVTSKNLEIVKELLAHGADVGIDNDYGKSPLYCAQDYRDSEIENALLDHGIDASIREKHCATPLQEAVRLGDLETVKELLAQRANPNTQDWKGKTALHDAVEYMTKSEFSFEDEENWDEVTRFKYMAVQSRGLEIVKELLVHGADANIKDRSESTPLLLAVWNEHCPLVDAILTGGKGINVNLVAFDGQTPLLRALQCSNLSIARELIKYGADLDIPDKKGMIAFFNSNYSDPSLKKYLVHVHQVGVDTQNKDHDGKLVARWCTCASELLAGANPNTQGKDGRTLLHCAVTYAPLASICETLKRGADVNIQDNEGRTALHEVLSHRYREEDRIDIVKELLAAGANPNLQDSCGETALHALINCHTGYMDGYELILLKELFASGANPNIQDKRGQTVLSATIQRGGRSSENFEKIRELLMRGANPNMHDDQGWFPLLHAVYYDGYTELVDLLCEYGADVNGRALADTSWRGETALQVAVGEKNLEMVEKLLSYGANPNTVDKEGCLILYKILARGRDDWKENFMSVVQAFLAHGADVNLQDKDAANALHKIVSRGCRSNYYFSLDEQTEIDLVKAVLAHGANPNLQDNDGNTVLGKALKNCSSKTVQELLAAGANPNSHDKDGQTDLLRADAKIKDSEENTAIGDGGRKGRSLAFLEMLKYKLWKNPFSFITNNK